MAQVTIYDPNGLCQIINGEPPVDQSALVAQLQAANAQLAQDLATRTAERDALQVKWNAALADAQARKDADNAKVEGQNLLDMGP